MILLLLSALSLSAATIRVPDDYSTIQAAIDAAVTKDTILIADGTYSGDGNRDLEIPVNLTIMSENGAAYTIIDAGGGPGDEHRCIEIAAGITVLLDITFENGYVETGVNTELAMSGAIKLNFMDSLEARNCLFRNNFASATGGVLAVPYFAFANFVNCSFVGNVAPMGSAVTAGGMYDHLNLTITGCTFYENIADASASVYGGGAVHCYNSGAIITDCWFENNRALGYFGGGAITSMHSDTALVVSHCTFVRNRGTLGGAMSFFYGSAPRIENCTFYGNVAERTEWPVFGVQHDGSGTIFYLAEACNDTLMAGEINNSTISFTSEGSALYTYYPDSCNPAPQFNCCNLYGNEAGDWTGIIEDQIDSSGNMSADPKFCDIAARDFRLQEHSPCLPENNTCGELIGDYGLGCPILDAPQIGCFSETISITAQAGEEICYYLFITNVADGEVTVTNDGTWSNDSLCFTPVSRGLHTFQIVAENAGGRDSCEVHFMVSIPEVYDVYPGGQIQPMLNIANSGDTVKVHDGVYTGEGNRDLDFLGKDIILTSVNGPKDCVIDGGTDTVGWSEYYRGIWFRRNESDKAVVNGFTFTRCYAYAIRCDSSTPVIQNCVFDHNGLGIVSRLRGNCQVLNCIFTNNMPVDDRGAGAAIYKASPLFENCLFQRNSGWGGGAAIQDAPSQPLFRYCSFIDNGFSYVDAYPLGGALFLSYGAHPRFENCTFSRNKGTGSTLYIWSDDPCYATFNRCIIAYGYDSPDGYYAGGPINCSEAGSSIMDLSCCNVYGNTAGDYIDCISGQNGVDGNFSADPLFCDTATADVHVQSGSPCLPENNSCEELIGAWSSGCYNTPAIDSCVVQYENVSVTYDTVTIAGHTSIEIDSSGPDMPVNITTVPTDPLRFYNISTSALYDGLVRICISYADDEVVGDESNMAMFHWVDTVWTSITVSHDTAANIICGETYSLSPFILAQPADPLAVDDSSKALPFDFHVSQNFPNPFNPTTTIEYSIPTRSRVTIRIYNVLGQVVRTLVDEEKAAGKYTVDWNGTSQTGESIATGIYLYRLQAGEREVTRKMLLLK